MPSNFSFLLPGKLAGMARPGVERTLEHDLRFLQAQGIQAIVSLTESALDQHALRAAGMDYCHLPIQDFHPPAAEQIERFVAFVEELLTASKPVAVHCTAGYGRTGTMLACYLVSAGQSARDAIAQVRRERPGSIETASQEACIREYARRLQHATGE